MIMSYLREKVSLGSLAKLISRPDLWPQLPGYVYQLRRYRKLEKELCGQLSRLRIYPCLDDKRPIQTVGSYFCQLVEVVSVRSS